MLAEYAPFEQDVSPDELRHVAVRKDKPDATQPWWEHLYYRLIFRRFLRFSFKYFHIPPPNILNADGSVSFLEGIGIATSEENADAMCKDEDYRVAILPVDVGLPKESVRYKGHAYPKSLMPDRYRRRTYPLMAASARQLEELQRNIVNNNRKAAGA